MPLPILDFSVDRGCLTSPRGPDRITSGIRLAGDGGYSGPDYHRAGNLPVPVSLVGLRERNESFKVSRHMSSCASSLQQTVRSATYYSRTPSTQKEEYKIRHMYNRRLILQQKRDIENCQL